MKRLLRGIALVALFSMLLSSQIFALTLDQTTSDSGVMPTLGVAPDNGIAEEPGGILTEKEIKKLQEHAKDVHVDKKGSGEVGTNHFSLTAHIHTIDNIYNTYDGYYDRGEVASGYNGKSSIDTLQFSITRTVSNGWSTTIGFSDGVVTTKVGYNVNWSESKTWGYSAQVSPYKTVHIGYQDWYHVQQFNCHTDWIFEGGYIYTEYGTGWAQQWFKPHFYSWET